MKYLLLLAFIMFSHAQAAESCNTIKTSYYLYKAQDNAVALLSCKTPGCIIRKTQKLERYACKAVNHCDYLAAQLESPCLSNNTLTPEARAEIIEESQQLLDIIIQKGLEYLRSIGQESGEPQNDQSDEQDSSADPLEDADHHDTAA